MSQGKERGLGDPGQGNLLTYLRRVLAGWLADRELIRPAEQKWGLWQYEELGRVGMWERSNRTKECTGLRVFTTGDSG